MHAGETLPTDLFEAAVDSADEYSKHARLFRMSCAVKCQFVVNLMTPHIGGSAPHRKKTPLNVSGVQKKPALSSRFGQSLTSRNQVWFRLFQV